jgi:hypothetical protein
MNVLSPRIVFGATLFSTPGLNGDGVRVPVLLTIVVAVITVSVALALLQRSWRAGPPDSDPGDGWSRGPKEPPSDSPLGPSGGIPLDDAVPARVRLRRAARLADMLPPRSRRQVREPERQPVREATPR